MKKALVKVVVFHLAVILAVILVMVSASRLESSQIDRYSYQAYYAELQKHNRFLPPPCSLETIEDGGVEQEGLIACKETKELPTAAQVNLWDGYIIWVSCEQYHSPYACEEMNN